MKAVDNPNQRVVIRLRRNQLDEARVLKEYEERSTFLGHADHDYIRHLILVGHLFVSMSSTEMNGKNAEAIALSTNESNNTGKERESSSSSNQSRSDSTSQKESEATDAGQVVGSAIRQMAAVFQGTNLSSGKTS